jgi:hypothetical protein
MLITPRVFKVLNRMGRFTEDNIHNINCGGCGYYAGYTAALLEYVPQVEDVCVRVGSYALGGRKNVNSVLATQRVKKESVADVLNNNGICNGHLVVEFLYRGRRNHYDTSGVVPARTKFDGFVFYPGFLTAEQTLEFCEDPPSWNSDFDRRQVPKLRLIIEGYIVKMMR